MPCKPAAGPAALPRAMATPFRRSLPGAVCGALLLFALARAGGAQTCFVYSDTEDALAPLTCVDKSDLITPCSWPTDCTTVPAAPGSQTILAMHTAWHDCFGNVGGNTPPAGRSQRWYAFHRQFEHDFNLWRRANGFDPIESLDWCPGMNLPVGTGPELGAGVHPAGCGTGDPRPPNLPCDDCIAFPQCLFLPGGGPLGCPLAPDPDCETPGGGVSFPLYDSLDDFANVDEVAKILDGQFHGAMHGAVANADCPGCFNQDVGNPNCSPRDPMFWRLHKALDDVVRAWQDAKAVDIVLVIDRSGSMNQPDAGGGTKWQAALAAVDNFADLLEDERSDGQTNRIGIVSFASGAAIDLAMTDVDASLRDAGSPFTNAVAALTAAGPGGCTGIGAGIAKALELLCPPGDCQGFSALGDNDRKGILLLTDGVENIPPCLQPAGAAGPGCGTQCFGAQLDYDKLEFTQLVAVGFGGAGSLNGDLLTLLAERQGGIYLHDPNLPDTDLKDFFTKAFGKLTDEFLLVDPRGLLAAGAAATPPVEYPTCGDRRLTFASGWQTPVAEGQVRLLVNTPAGNLVRGAGVETSLEPTWEFDRVDLPYRGENAGTWRAQLVRPHAVYVNGFAPDALANPTAGITLVRRQIQRLCPNGCARVLAYEAGRKGAVSVYQQAVQREVAAGLLGAVTNPKTPLGLANALSSQSWDLIVYARMGAAASEPYDSLLASRICQGQRAILTDPRPQADPILQCAGMERDGSLNWASFAGDGLLFSGTLAIINPGHPVASYGVRATVAQVSVQGTANAGANGAVAARITDGLAQHWYLNILGLGLSKLDVYHRSLDQRTGDELYAMARMLPSYIPAGGFDSVNARVEVTYPQVGLGTLITQSYKPGSQTASGEIIGPRALAAESVPLPLVKATFPLNDDGTLGDLYPRNGNWTAKLTGLGATDGPYTLRYTFDLTKNGCTTRRELMHSTYVDVRVSPSASELRVVDQRTLPDGGLRTVVTLRPIDNFGNLWGPGRAEIGGCEPANACRVDPESVVDPGDGSYSLAVETGPGLPGVRLLLMDAVFDLPLSCTSCPSLSGLELAAPTSKEHSFVQGTVRLRAPAPAAGAVVFLASSNREAAAVPDRVIVPAGATEAAFEIAVQHAHSGPAPSTLSARYGASEATATLTVLPLRATAGPSGEPRAIPVKAGHTQHGGHSGHYPSPGAEGSPPPDKDR